MDGNGDRRKPALSWSPSWFWGARLQFPLRFLYQFPRWIAKRVAKLYECFKAGVAFPELDKADVGVVTVGLLG